MHTIAPSRLKDFKNGIFSTLAALPIGVAATGNNYTYADQVTPPTNTFAALDATALGAFQNDIKDYTGAVGQTVAGAFTALICEQDAVDGATPADDAAEGTTAGEISCGAASTNITQ